MKQQEKTKVGRRDFLRALGAGAGRGRDGGRTTRHRGQPTPKPTRKRRKARYKANPPTCRPSTGSTVIRAEGG